MTQKKYTLSLDGLPDHEGIIFKLICSVSERSKNREHSYCLTVDPTASNINISDIKNKSAEETKPHSISVWVADKNQDDSNVISRPLIATRVLNTLDQLIKNHTPLSHEAPTVETKDTNPPVNLEITEEEASELAIVHDEILENPANEKDDQIASNLELTLIKNNIQKKPSANNIPHVLVVDDSPSVRKQLEIELEYFDVAVDFADCAAKAFELIDKNDYDMTLLDVVLPDKDGFQICKHVKAKSKATIAIMLTGRATQADKIKGSLAGCNAYLVKPVGRVTFQNAVKHYIPMKNTKTAIEA